MSFTLEPPLLRSDILHAHPSQLWQANNDKNDTQQLGTHSSSLSLLPVVYDDGSHNLHMINEGDDASIQKYLAWDLTLPWLNDIHDHLWLAGRPMSARSLHRQAMLGRAMVITEQVDLHMVRQDGRIFLKPLPDYLLSYDFWIQYLCKDVNLYECACGFLLSYVWLISSKSDMRLAQRENLLDPEITWAS